MLIMLSLLLRLWATLVMKDTLIRTWLIQRNSGLALLLDIKIISFHMHLTRIQIRFMYRVLPTVTHSTTDSLLILRNQSHLKQSFMIRNIQLMVTQAHFKVFQMLSMFIRQLGMNHLH